MPKKRVKARDILGVRPTPHSAPYLPEGFAPEEEAQDLNEIGDVIPQVEHRSYVPAKLLDVYPSTCISKHPTEKRICKVSITRFMHQVEKEKKPNGVNKRFRVDGQRYVIWQFMPKKMIQQYLSTGDRFFTPHTQDVPL